jgi:alpha-tubulin suppressor-like RCC1 family protein
MSDSDGKSTSVVFLCGGGSDGRIGLCDSTLFENAVHEVATNGDDLIALCHDGCYNLSTGLLVHGCGFKASHFCAGMKVSYALSCDGSLVYSWGEGSYGELGLGLCKTRVQEPTPVKHKSSFNSISCGEHHCVVLDITGNAYSWGQNFDRQLGLYSNDSSKFKSPNYMVEEVMFVPSLLPFSLRHPIKKVSCGARFTVAIGMNGDLWSWGAGDCGQLGTGICTKKEAPSKVLIYAPLASIHEDSDIIVVNKIEEKNTVKVADVACGDSHVLAVGNDGSTYVWGLNNRGQLGLEDTDSKSFPSLIPSFTCSKVYANGLSSAGISAEGDLYTWGSGSKFRLMHQTEQGDDRLGDNAHKLTPTFVDALYGNIVKCFAFSCNGSAALVITRLYEVITITALSYHSLIFLLWIRGSSTYLPMATYHLLLITSTP